MRIMAVVLVWIVVALLGCVVLGAIGIVSRRPFDIISFALASLFTIFYVCLVVRCVVDHWSLFHDDSST